MTEVQAVLNTQVYLKGTPFDREGDDTYQLPGWSKNARMTNLLFLKDDGDATRVRLQFYDRDAEVPTAKILYEIEVVGSHHRMFDEPVDLLGAKKDRIYLRITALDGEQQNHCKLIIRGNEIDDAREIKESRA